MSGAWSKETMHKLSTAKTVAFKFKKLDGGRRLTKDTASPVAAKCIA